MNPSYWARGPGGPLLLIWKREEKVGTEQGRTRKWLSISLSIKAIIVAFQGPAGSVFKPHPFYLSSEPVRGGKEVSENSQEGAGLIKTYVKIFRWITKNLFLLKTIFFFWKSNCSWQLSPWLRFLILLSLHSLPWLLYCSLSMTGPRTFAFAMSLPVMTLPPDSVRLTSSLLSKMPLLNEILPAHPPTPTTPYPFPCCIFHL